MKRRGRNEGSKRPRKDGRLEVRISLGRDPLTGKRLRKSLYSHTDADATANLRRAGGQALDGELIATSTPTVAVFLDEWYATHCDEWRPKTQTCYAAAIRLYLKPAFGHLRLEQLGPRVVQRWLNDHKSAHGARRRVTLAHAVLRSALTWAQQQQLVAFNAATRVVVSKPTPGRATNTLDIARATRFLAAAKRHEQGPLFSIALACGLRLGEATGLRWDNVNLTTGRVEVRQQLQLVKLSDDEPWRLVLAPLKTEKSRRDLTLPKVVLVALRAYRTKQREWQLKAGARWVETGLVFTTKLGTALGPRNVLRALHRMMRGAKLLPVLKFHELRHSAASLLLAQGVQLAEITLLLGHSELRVTVDTYGHLQQQTAVRTALIMDDVLSSRRRR